MYKNWAYFLSWTCLLLCVCDGNEVSSFLRLDWLTEKKTQSMWKHWWLVVWNPSEADQWRFLVSWPWKTHWRSATWPVKCSLWWWKKIYIKKMTTWVQASIAYNFFPHYSSLGTKKKQEDRIWKSSRHLEIAATSININTLLLNQRKKGKMTQKPSGYAFSRANDWLSTDWRVNDGIFEATDDRKWRYVVKWKVILCIIN